MKLRLVTTHVSFSYGMGTDALYSCNAWRRMQEKYIRRWTAMTGAGAVLPWKGAARHETKRE